jgi:peroxiredoxin
MIELGKLEARADAFESRGVRIVVSSLEDQPTAALTAKDFPRLTVLSDENGALADALRIVHPDSNPYGGDTSAPTTLLLDGQGRIQWIHRPVRYIERLTPEQLLDVIDRYDPPGNAERAEPISLRRFRRAHYGVFVAAA